MRTELTEQLKRLWAAGTLGKTAQAKRPIVLTNQVAFFAAVATLPYQLFYLFYDLGQYLGVFLANIAFTVIYAAVIGLNYLGWNSEAKITMLSNACVHALVATMFVGSEAGIQLFYFVIACFLALSYDRRHGGRFMVSMCVVGCLFLIAHFGFPMNLAFSPLPAPFTPLMFALSAIAVLLVLGGFAMLFRKEIDDAHQALIQTNEQLTELSTTDTLTGLGNRRQLDTHLARACQRLRRRFQPLSLIMCDVDHFKLYNDNLGHPAGDACLKQVADALSKSVMRKGDTVARYGGVLPNTDAQGALLVAQALREAVQALELPHIAKTGQPYVTISIGVATLASPAPDTSPAEMLARADEALYLAKANGRNRVEALAVKRQHPTLIKTLAG